MVKLIECLRRTDTESLFWRLLSLEPLAWMGWLELWEEEWSKGVRKVWEERNGDDRVVGRTSSTHIVWLLARSLQSYEEITDLFLNLALLLLWGLVSVFDPCWCYEARRKRHSWGSTWTSWRSQWIVLAVLDWRGLQRMVFENLNLHTFIGCGRWDEGGLKWGDQLIRISPSISPRVLIRKPKTRANICHPATMRGQSNSFDSLVLWILNWVRILLCNCNTGEREILYPRKKGTGWDLSSRHRLEFQNQSSLLSSSMYTKGSLREWFLTPLQ